MTKESGLCVCMRAYALADFARPRCFEGGGGGSHEKGSGGQGSWLDLQPWVAQLTSLYTLFYADMLFPKILTYTLVVIALC